MINDFVPLFLGASHLKRDEWVGHNTPLVNELFDLQNNEFVSCSDATYSYCQKSFNNSLQRDTWSSQKKRHLVKPFVICATDGYIIDVYGPYIAKDNDATILRELMCKNKELRELHKPKDLMILDRGFRDVVRELKSDYELDVKMPICVPNSRKDGRLTTLEANMSRFVTKIRYIIEVINGVFKNSFKALDSIINKRIKNIINDYRIAAALINAFHKRRFTDGAAAVEVAKLMKAKKNTKNLLETGTKKFVLGKNFVKLDALNINDFPKIENISDIERYITFRSYQLKQAESYIGILTLIIY